MNLDEDRDNPSYLPARAFREGVFDAVAYGSRLVLDRFAQIALGYARCLAAGLAVGLLVDLVALAVDHYLVELIARTYLNLHRLLDVQLLLQLSDDPRLQPLDELVELHVLVGFAFLEIIFELGALPVS